MRSKPYTEYAAQGTSEHPIVLPSVISRLPVDKVRRLRVDGARIEPQDFRSVSEIGRAQMAERSVLKPL